jgi:tight adherence protein B
MQNKKFFRPLVISISALLISALLTKSAVISIALTIAIAVIFTLSERQLNNRSSWEFHNALPELIDYIISGIQSGLSLNESLISLSERGPKISQPIFEEFRVAITSGEKFEDAISKAQDDFSSRSADQLFEALLFAKSLGGSELVTLLRQLGDFTRQELALRREIAAKQSWIRNSAHLSAAAPWLLLLLLSTQSSTAHAYSTSAGVLILCCGVTMTAIAYLWMGHLGKMPENPRIFGLR